MIDIENLASELAAIAPDALKAEDNTMPPNFGLFFELLVSDNVQGEEINSHAGHLDLVSTESRQYSSINHQTSISTTPAKHPNSLTIVTSGLTKVRLKSWPPEQNMPRTPD